MAGHFPLSKFDEPEVFQLVERIKSRVVSMGKIRNDFSIFKISISGKKFDCMKLSSDYVENPVSEMAFKIGRFSLKSIDDEHPSLTKNISLECHFKTDEFGISIVNIFWVA